MNCNEIAAALSEFGRKFIDSMSEWATDADYKETTLIDWNLVAEWSVVVVAVFLLFIFLSYRKKIFDILSRYIALAAGCVWLLGVFVYIVGFYREGITGWSVIPRSIMSSFKMFVVAHDLARVSSGLQANASYMTMFALTHFAAAFLTFLFIFKMIGYKMVTSLRILLYKWFKAERYDIHVFWGVNEPSCLLAEDIKRHNEEAQFLFIDIDKDSGDNAKKKASLIHITNTITITDSEMNRLENIGALVDHCYNGPAELDESATRDVFDALKLRRVGKIVRKSRKCYFYFLSDDEVQNITGALNLQKDELLLSLYLKPEIFVHARKDASNEVFDHYSQYNVESKSVMKIKVVDSSCLSVLNLKHDLNALPVKCVKSDETPGLVDTPFNSLIVGFGETGQEAFKFLYEFGAFVGSDLKKTPFTCYAIDEKMNKMSGLIRTKMPAITDKELVLVQASVESDVFWEKLKEIINDLNYVVIALNNDDLGLPLAVNLFKFALMNRTHDHMLKIMIRCYDTSNLAKMKEVVGCLNGSVDGIKIEIGVFGEPKDIFTCAATLSDTVMTEAKEYNKVYENSSLSGDKQWDMNFGEDAITTFMKKKQVSRYHAIYDINRRISQNISNSLHNQTKLILMGFDKDDIFERLKLYCEYVDTRKSGEARYNCDESAARLLENMARVEHERWIASHKLMGYVYAENTDFVKKTHKCLCEWDKLDECTRSYDSNVVDTAIKMAYQKVLAKREG